MCVIENDHEQVCAEWNLVKPTAFCVTPLSLDDDCIMHDRASAENSSAATRKLLVASTCIRASLLYFPSVAFSALLGHA